MSDDLTAYVTAGSDLARALADPTRPYLYVSDRANGSVVFFNTTTNQVDKTLPVGAGADWMDIRADAAFLFVGLSGSPQVAVVNLATQSVQTLIQVPNSPNALAVGANNRLYVSTTGLTDSIQIFDIGTNTPASAGTIPRSGAVIAGVTADRNRLFTHDLSTSSQLAEWDISTGNPAQIQLADVYSGPIVLRSSPDSSEFVYVGDFDYFGTRSPEYDGDVPVVRVSDLTTRTTLNVEWDPIAVEYCGSSIFVAHTDQVTNSTRATRHDQGSGDLHRFSAATGVASGLYSLRQHVADYGIACAGNGRVYLLLGDERPRTGPSQGGLVTATAIGVLTP